MQDLEFVALDCETSGLKAHENYVIEVGAVKFSLQGSGASFDQLFCPPTRLSKIVERLTGIQNSALKNAPLFSAKKQEFQQFCGKAILIGHNLQFDLDFLAKSGCDLSNNFTFDTFQLAQTLLKRNHYSLALGRLAADFKLPKRTAHRALADAETTRDLFLALLQKAQQFPPKCWQEIAQLKLAQAHSLQRFAELVLKFSANPPSSKLIPASVNSASTDFPTDHLEDFALRATDQNGNQILETTRKPETIPAELVFLPQVPFNKPRIFASENYYCRERLTKFLSRKLTALEMPLAAKLILHIAPLPEIFTTPSEKILFQQVAADKNCQKRHSTCPFVRQTSGTRVYSNHASFFFFTQDPRKKLVASALEFFDNQENTVSLTLELPLLETFLPQAKTELTLLWGLFGILFQRTAPQYGILDFAKVSPSPYFARVKSAIQNLLTKFDMPSEFAQAFQKVITLDFESKIELRLNAENEPLLKIKPRRLQFPPFQNTIFSDVALGLRSREVKEKKVATAFEPSSQLNFTFVRKLFALSPETPARAEPLPKPYPRLIIVRNLPKLADCTAATTSFLLNLLKKTKTSANIAFPNRRELGPFFEQACGQLSQPIFAKKIPAYLPENFVFLNTIVSSLWPVNVKNFFLVKLPFLGYSPEANWATETLPKACLKLKKIWRQNLTVERFFLLDPRLTTQSYGLDFLANLESSPEFMEA